MGGDGDSHPRILQVEGEAVRLCVAGEVVSKSMGILGKVYCFDGVDGSRGSGLDGRRREPSRIGFSG